MTWRQDRRVKQVWRVTRLQWQRAEVLGRPGWRWNASGGRWQNPSVCCQHCLNSGHKSGNCDVAPETSSQGCSTGGRQQGTRGWCSPGVTAEGPRGWRHNGQWPGARGWFHQGCWQGAWRRSRQGAKSTSQLGCWQGTRDCRADPGTVESIDRGTTRHGPTKGQTRHCTNHPESGLPGPLTSELMGHHRGSEQQRLVCWAAGAPLLGSGNEDDLELGTREATCHLGPWFLKGALLIVSWVRRKGVSKDLSKESPGWRPASTGSISGLRLAGYMQSPAWEPLESIMADIAFLGLAVQEKSEATPGAPQHRGLKFINNNFNHLWPSAFLKHEVRGQQWLKYTGLCN